MIAAVLPHNISESSSTSEMLTDADVMWFPLSRPNPNSYTLTNTLPSWFFNSIQQLGYLQASLKDDWDSYGAKKISPQSVDLAIDLLQLIVQSDTPPPSLVPSPSGHIQAEWHTGGIDLEVEFESATSIRVLFEDLNDPNRDWEDVLSTDLTSLSSAVVEVTRR